MRTLALGQLTTHLLPAIKGHRLYAAFLTLFMMGLRRGELLGIRWQDIDWKGEFMHIRQTLVRVKNHAIGRTHLIFQEPKTAYSRRTIPLPGACLAALRHHRAQQAEEKLALGPAYQDHGLVFCLAHGGPIDPRNLSLYFSQVLERAGLPAMRLHDARHTFATLMLELGESPKTVQTMLGHSRVAITLDIYSHVSLELEKKAAAKLDAALMSGLQ